MNLCESLTHSKFRLLFCSLCETSLRQNKHARPSVALSSPLPGGGRNMHQSCRDDASEEAIRHGVQADLRNESRIRTVDLSVRALQNLPAWAALLQCINYKYHGLLLLYMPIQLPLDKIVKSDAAFLFSKPAQSALCANAKIEI